MALSATLQTLTKEFDPNGKDLRDGRDAERLYRAVRLASNDLFPPGTYYKFGDANGNEDYNGIDWWQFYYVGYKLVEKSIVQVKIKAHDAEMLVEVRRGDIQEGWMQKLYNRYLDGIPVYIVEQKRKANVFKIIPIQHVYRETVKAWGTGIMTDPPTLTARYNDVSTEETDEARWGALGQGGFEPRVHFKNSKFNGRPCRDVLVHLNDKAFAPSEYELLPIPPGFKAEDPIK